jgi:tetratricopeptide (TPR) repeat protein
VLAVAPLVIHSLGAPLGEPVADDFACLHRAYFTHGLPFFDGYGSALYWRPLSRQLYFKLLAPLMLPRPGWIAAFHVALLMLVSLLLYRALRAQLGGPRAALAASFPLLMESTRMLIAWPSNFQDLGAMLFAALAIHEAAAARLASTLAALLASLLCKELAAPAALLLPWLPAAAPRHRRRWLVGIAATVGAWAIAYTIVHRSAGLAWPHPEGTEPTRSWPERYLWACGNVARAALSLPVSSSALDALALGVLLLAALAVAALAMSAPVRARLSLSLPWVGWGCAWFAAGSLTVAATYPDWLAYRGAFAAMGLGVALAAFAGAAHPLLAGVLLALRLALFALSPGPPARVDIQAEERGALFDFPKLARLQRLVGATRHALHERVPTLPAGGRVGIYNLPWMAQYAFSGSEALQVWYRDSTLRWVRGSELARSRDASLAAIVEYEIAGEVPIVLVEPEALRQLMNATAIGDRGDWASSLALVDRADSLQRVPALAFAGETAAVRAVALANLGRLEEAEREARRSDQLLPGNPNAHLALGIVAYVYGRLAEADAQMDTVLYSKPRYRPAVQLRAAIRKARP